MASFKPKVLALCKKVASESGEWQFVSGVFVNKISKNVHFAIHPQLVFKGSSIFFNIRGCVRMPKIVKMVNSISALNKSNGFKLQYIVTEQLNLINKSSLTGGMRFKFETNDMITDELIELEINRWLNSAGCYLKETWPVDNDIKLFKTMKNSYICYQGLYAIALLCMAASLGDFDFIKRFYAGELPHRASNVELTETDENLLAVLPDWQKQWETTGKIKV